MSGADACRRCSECPGQDHHWLMPEAVVDGESMASCKHCPATALLCDECESLDEPLADCETCHGLVYYDVRTTPRPGVCRECSCTDDYACEGGCAWVDDEHTLCSECVEAA